MKSKVRRHVRSTRGQHIAEFAAALVLLVLCFFVPMLDLGIMPVRYFMSQEIIASYARRLSLCESLSQAYAVMNADPSLETKLIKLGGVKPQNLHLALLISRVKPPPERIVVEVPKTIPLEWLPGGRRGPCEYILEVRADVEISPAILLSGASPKIMGLNTPVPFTISSTSPWENMGRNPVTKAYFINE